MKICLLTQDEHSSIGAKLSGIKTLLCKKNDLKDIEGNWEKAISDPSVAILLVSQSIYNSISEKLEDYKKLAKKPFIVMLPEYGKYYEIDKITSLDQESTEEFDNDRTRK